MRRHEPPEKNKARSGAGQESNQFDRHSTSTDAQQQRLLAALRVEPVTTFEGRTRLGVPHVAGRIRELREAGFSIITTWTTARSRMGTRHRIARYLLVGEPKRTEASQ